MDRLDVKIIAELLGADAAPLNIRKSFRAISRKLGVDENTVRNRVSKLRRSGFLKGWLIGVNPNIFGERVARLWFDVQPQSGKASAIAKISLIQGVSLVIDYFGASLSVVLNYEDEGILKKTTELIARIANSDNMVWGKVPFPKCNIPLSANDWMIIRSLQRNPWKSFSEVAKELGLTPITIKRRVARMNGTGALFMLVDINPKAVEGSLLAHLVVFYNPPDSRQKVNERISDYLGDQIAFGDLDDAEHGFFALMVTNISRIQEILSWVKLQPGVRTARLDVLQDMITFPSFYEAHVQKGLRTATRVQSQIR